MSESSRGDTTNYKTTFDPGDRVQPRPHITIDNRPAVEVDGAGVVRRTTILDAGGELVHVRHDNGRETSWPADQLEMVAAERVPSAAACPTCKSTEAWHGVITEPGEPERWACDECGTSLSVSVREPKPAKAGFPEVKPARRPVVSRLGTRLIGVVVELLDAIEDDAAHEKACADFGMHMLTLLGRGRSEDVTLTHLEAAALALGMSPAQLLREATS